MLKAPHPRLKQLRRPSQTNSNLHLLLRAHRRIQRRHNRRARISYLPVAKLRPLRPRRRLHRVPAAAVAINRARRRAAVSRAHRRAVHPRAVPALQLCRSQIKARRRQAQLHRLPAAHRARRPAAPRALLLPLQPIRARIPRAAALRPATSRPALRALPAPVRECPRAI